MGMGGNLEPLKGFIICLLMENLLDLTGLEPSKVQKLQSYIIDLGMVETPVLGGEDRRGVYDDPGEQAAALRPHPRLTTDRL